MNEIFHFLIIFTIGYVASMVFVFIVVRLFFPFFTREELARKKQLTLLK